MACQECGGPVACKRADAIFCSLPCRRVFNNRRIQRGGEFYDLIMEMRFDRKRADATKAWSLLCTIAGRFRDEDKTERAGRRSWSSSTRMGRVNSRLGR